MRIKTQMQGGWLRNAVQTPQGCVVGAVARAEVPERPGALPRIRATLAEMLGLCSLRPTRARG
jgi:hypothetical protein